MFSKRYFACALLLAAFVLVLSQAEPVQAQIPGILGLPDVYGEAKPPEVGTYVKYRFYDEKAKTESFFKVSVVGKEKVEGKDCFWCESERTEAKATSPIIFKLLLCGDAKQQIVKRMIIKSGKEPARELPEAVMSLMAVGFKGAELESKKVGTEKVKTKMGTFDCQHTQEILGDKQVRDSWISAKVPLLGVVKRTKGSGMLELLEHGAGAVTAIKETPQVLQMPGEK